MESKSLFKSVFPGTALLIGLCVLGMSVFKGLKTFSDKDRVVTVKGLAEMNMEATSASISIDFSFSGDNLQEIIKQKDVRKDAILDYLIKSGYNRNSIKVENLDITDRERYYETQWEGGRQVQVKIDRYTVRQVLTFSSKEVKATEDKSSQIELDLISKGLTSRVTSNYTFPELNSIKPQLIAASTKNARVAGEQFANDSQAKLGKIKTASQGQISIVGKSYYDEDAAPVTSEQSNLPYIQKARVVSTIVFFLE